MWSTVLHARHLVLEAVLVALTAAVDKLLTLHGGHVEEVTPENGPAMTLLLLEPADLGDLWYPKTCFLTFHKTHEVVAIPLAASIAELLTLLSDSIVVVTLAISSARSLIYLKKTHLLFR